MAGSLKETASANGVESSNGVGKSKSSAGHCKRFWWVYLLVLVVIVVIVVPVVLLVAVPKIAQRKLNDAKLHVDSIVISQSKTNSLHMAINSSITSDGDVHATVHGFEGTMYLTDVEPPLAFAQVQFPETSSESLVLVNVSQELQISDMAALTTFNTYLLANETLTVRIKGDTTVRVSGIARDYPVTFEKDVQMAGFNGFKGTYVTNANVTAGGSTNNFNATAHLPNPTIWTIDVGTIFFHNYFNGAEIGTNYMRNVTLRPGDNPNFIWADIEQGPVLRALVEEPYCKGANMTFQLSGKSVTSQHDGQPVPWFAGPLASANTSVSINIVGALNRTSGLVLPCTSNSTTSRRSSNLFNLPFLP